MKLKELILLILLCWSFSCEGQSLYIHYLSQGQTLAQAGEMDKAMEYFERGIKFYPDSLAFYNGKGIVLESRGDFDGSIKQFTKMIELDSENYWGYFNRARVYRLKKQHKEACDDYRSAFQLGYLDARKYFNDGCGFINDPNDLNSYPIVEDVINEEN